MHETGIAVEILRSALSAAEERESRAPIRLLEVGVAVGELASIDPNLLKQAWASVVAEGPHRKAELRVRWCPVCRTCPTCNSAKAGPNGEALHQCPDCHGPLAVEGGDELELESVEFEEVFSPQPN
jgi:Zn finger protein HypA/HybF involved in hydrogenase expression